MRLVFSIILSLAATQVVASAYTIDQVREFCREFEKYETNQDYDEMMFAACIGFFHGYKAAQVAACDKLINQSKNKSVIPDELFQLLLWTPEISAFEPSELVRHFYDYSDKNKKLWNTRVWASFDIYLAIQTQACNRTDAPLAKGN